MSNFIFSILKDALLEDASILDPCVGKGSLLLPFIEHGTYNTIGVDIEDAGFPDTIVQNYLSIDTWLLKEPNIVLINPPFNVDKKNKQYIKETYGGRPLLSELFLSKTIDLFGLDMPIVLISPYGLRLNQSITSKRWKKFSSGKYPEISSIISLPKDVFPNVLFHSEILLFNIYGIKPHYFYN